MVRPDVKNLPDYKNSLRIHKQVPRKANHSIDQWTDCLNTYIMWLRIITYASHYHQGNLLCLYKTIRFILFFTELHEHLTIKHN